MVEVVGVRFKGGTRTYYFNPNNIRFRKHADVIVETKNGLEVGIVSVENKKVEEADIVLPLKTVVRLVTDADKTKIAKNEEVKEKAKTIFMEKAAAEKLDIQLVDVQYNFEGTHVVFSYTSDNRIDFRNLVKNLAQNLRVRIEMRQINMREKARLIGGIGPCGYDLCCSTFLQDLHGSTIKMVKNQRLTLVPERISGLCGKLLCCLRYENDIYTELAEVLPDVNQIIETPDGIGKVVYLNVLNQKIDVLFTDGAGGHQKRQYKYEELKESLEKANMNAVKKKSKAKKKPKEVSETNIDSVTSNENTATKKQIKNKSKNFKKQQSQTKSKQENSQNMKKEQPRKQFKNKKVQA